MSKCYMSCEKMHTLRLMDIRRKVKKATSKRPSMQLNAYPRHDPVSLATASIAKANIRNSPKKYTRNHTLLETWI